MSGVNVEENTKVSWRNPLRDKDHYVTMRNTLREQWLERKAYHRRILSVLHSMIEPNQMIWTSLVRLGASNNTFHYQ